MKITLISDTHNKHKRLTSRLPGGDLILCGGDISSMGYEHEVREFCKWYDSLDYSLKPFIAGNHDWGFQNNTEKALEIVSEYKSIKYLQDETLTIDGVNIYGSPWQPEFYNWAFNLPRMGKELQNKWDDIPENTDILITHGPPYGILDDVEHNRGVHLGCELLAQRVKEIKPKIHIFGHIHSGHGYYFDGYTHYFNASVLDEDYVDFNDIFTFDWDPIKNTIDNLERT